MTAAPLHIAGERVMLDPAGAAFWPAQSLLAVADLHLEKGSAAAARGQLVPPWDTRATLDVLAGLLRRYSPRLVVALGDSFHDSRGSSRLLAGDSQRLAMMTRATRFVWVLGNHDPAPQDGMAGEITPEFRLGRLLFRHQAQSRKAGEAELSGHFHPKAAVAVKGATVSRPCFVADGYRLLLPALGAYTGGLDVRDPAIASLFPRGGRIFLLGRERLFSFALPARRGKAEDVETSFI
jgi:DNA ligase-associated metallophosphoesterase